MNWLFRILVPLLIFIVFVLIFQHGLLPPSTTSLTSSFTNENPTPRLAYVISGSDGDGEMLKRILQAIYHPNNFYIVNVDRSVSDNEVNDLFNYVNSHAVFLAVRNVKMIDDAYVVSENGSTKIASVLQAAAVLLKEGGRWDWFINLDASSYPLVTQDDLLHVLSKTPRHLNFIDHAPCSIWFLEDGRSEIMVNDQGLYMPEGGVTVLSEKREEPTDFRLFAGSSLMALTRSFVEYCVWGWDNFPRTLLMYHANSVSPAESYFQTVVSNSLEFIETAVNTDLHFTARDRLYRPRFITYDDDLRSLMDSNAPFARKFSEWTDDDVLNFIDSNLLLRSPGMLVRGGWCAGTNGSDRCMRVGDVTKLQPRDGALRLQHFFDHQCKKHAMIHNGSVLPAQCNKYG